jgi:hypothetical protein
VRSLAATAADDAQVASTVPTPAVPAAAASGAPPIATPAAGVPVTRPVDPAVRPGRISSSTAMVASGSFHTIPAVTSAARASEIQRRKRRQIYPLASIVVVGVAAGAAVFFIMNSFRERDRPSTAPPITAQPNAGQPNAAQPAAAQAAAGQPAAGQPNAAQPAAGQPDTGQPPTGQPNAGRLHPRVSQDTGRPISGQQDARLPHIEQLHTRPPAPGLPHGEHQHTGAADHDGSGSAAAPAGGGSDQAKPALCRVRINLTPWAYYTADDDPARHETPSTVELTPGRHRLHVWNPELHVERDIAITVPADRDTMNYSEPLQPSMLAPDAGSSN